jgi:PAS domain S-box-containing protein
MDKANERNMLEIDLRKFGSLVEHSADAVISTDASLTIATWNKAAEELYGFSALEATGKQLDLLLNLRRTKDQRINGLDGLEKNDFYEDIYAVENSGKQNLYVHASIFALKSAANTIFGYIATHRRAIDLEIKGINFVGRKERLGNAVQKKGYQLPHIFEKITDAFVALDDQWRYTYMNKKAGEFFSREPAAMIGKHIWKEFPEGIGQPFYYAYYAAMASQEYVHLEEYYQPYNRWFENHVYPSIDGLSIFFRDITVQKQIEEDARLTNQRLLLHVTNSPLAVVEWDSNYIFTSWSQQAESIFGWSKTEVVNKSVFEINLIYEDDIEEVSSAISRLLKGEIASIKVVNRNKTKNGKVITCEWYNSVLIDDKGNVTSCMSLVQDISQKKKAEELLAINEQQLDLIYNSSSDILFLIDVESIGRYKFITINNAFKTATGLTSDQILGKYVDAVIPKSSLPLVLKKYKEAIESKRTLQWEEVSEFPSGIRTGLVSVTPVYDNNDKCIRLVGSVHDITENKKAEVELKEKNEQLRSLSAHLQEIREDERAHIAREIHDELGARLTGIRLDISWIQSQFSSNKFPVAHKFPALIELVDDTIKTVRKLSTELRPSILDDFGLVDAVEWQAAEFEKRTGISCKVKSFIRKQINNKKIEITLFRIFQESLTNILRHSGARNVCVQLHDENDIIELTITDDGVGMDPEAVKNKQTLGLIGMKERVLMVDGDYHVSSEIGKGTTIMVSVPYSQALNR